MLLILTKNSNTMKKKPTFEIKLIHSIDIDEYRITINGESICYPLKDETKAKAIAFDEILKAQMLGTVNYVSYQSF